MKKWLKLKPIRFVQALISFVVLLAKAPEWLPRTQVKVVPNILLARRPSRVTQSRLEVVNRFIVGLAVLEPSVAQLRLRTRSLSKVTPIFSFVLPSESLLEPQNRGPFVLVIEGLRKGMTASAI